MQPDAVLELEALDLLGRHPRGIEVLSRHHGRFLDEAVSHRSSKRIVEHHVLERHRPFVRLHEGSSREFQAKHRLELIDCAHTRRCAIPMGLVHEQHEIGERGEVVEVALADVLRKSLDTRSLAAAYFGIDLRDVEDIHLAADELVEQRPRAALVVVARDDFGGVRGEFGDALEHVLGRIRCEVGDQLVVDRQVGREHEEVVEPVGQMQVADERTHEACLADARRQRETN